MIGFAPVMIAPGDVLESDGHGEVVACDRRVCRRMEDAWGAAVHRVTNGVDGDTTQDTLFLQILGKLGGHAADHPRLHAKFVPAPAQTHGRHRPVSYITTRRTPPHLEP